MIIKKSNIKMHELSLPNIPNILRKNRMSLIYILGVILAIFHLYTCYFGILPILLQRSIHVAFGLMLIFLVKPFRGWKTNLWLFVDSVLIILTICSIFHIMLNFQRLEERIVFMDPVTLGDKVFGVITILLVIIATWRMLGPPMPIIALVGIGYVFSGKFIPSFLGHPGVPFDQFIEEMYLTTLGIYGTPIGISSTYIFLFIIFGTFLVNTGIGEIFIKLAIGLVGGLRGGPAKAAVLSSSLIATISGSSVANVYCTGSVTIPLMKRMGYKPSFAAAVEAAASTGGQIMPPIMGAAAFIVAEFVGINYWNLAVAAIMPALLYYFSIFMTVDLESVTSKLKGMTRDKIPDAKKILKKDFIYLLPLISIIYLLAKGYTPNLASFVGILVVIGVSFVKKKTRLSIKQLLETLRDSSLRALSIIVACATAGIIINVAFSTGLGLKFVSLIVSLSLGYLMLALVLTMITSIILGMGMPTSGAYILTAILAAPTLIKMGVPALSAHMFVFYFACLSAITPPVALASYAAASIAGSSFTETSKQAIRIAIMGFIVPYTFIFNQNLLGINGLGKAFISFFLVLPGLLLIVFSLNVWFNKAKRSFEKIISILGILGGLCLFTQSLQTYLLGIGLGIMFFYIQFNKPKINK